MAAMFHSVQRKVMDNGLTVILKQFSSPLVIIEVWVKAGYFNEPDEKTGISHFLEHMFFKGTKKRGVGELAKEVKSLGGTLNGGTFYENTYYYVILPVQYFENGLEMLSDALVNISLDPDEVKKEGQVVIQEIKRKLDSPADFAWEKLMGVAFERHPLRRWRIGTEEQIAQMTRDDLFDFYKIFYQPENIILSIVGGIKAEKSLSLIESYFRFPNQNKLPKQKIPEEPEQKNIRREEIEGDIKTTYLLLGYHVPGRTASDYYSLAVLNQILGVAKSSRLNKILKEEKKLVTDIDAEVFCLKDLGMLIISAELMKSNISSAKEEILREIDRIANEGISDFELEKAKNGMENRYLRELEKVRGQAENLAMFEQYGDYRLLEKSLEYLRDVKKEEVRSSCSRYLKIKGVSSLEYLSKNSD
jgi:zinc protease